MAALLASMGKAVFHVGYIYLILLSRQTGYIAVVALVGLLCNDLQAIEECSDGALRDARTLSLSKLIYSEEVEAYLLVKIYPSYNFSV